MFAASYWPDAYFAPRYWPKDAVSLNRAHTHIRSARTITTAPKQAFRVRKARTLTTRPQDP